MVISIFQRYKIRNWSTIQVKYADTSKTLISIYRFQ